MPTGIAKDPLQKSLRCREAALRDGRLPPTFRGKSHTEESKQKMRKKLCGEAHYNWRGGISFLKSYRVAKQQERRARILANGGDVSVTEWEKLKEEHCHTCLGCGKREPDIVLTMDHVIPISRGGAHSIENIQPLCGPCNSRKYNK